MPSNVKEGWGNKSTTDATVEGGDINATIDGISLTNFSKIGSLVSIAPSVKTTIVSQVYILGTFENAVMLAVSGTGYAKYFFAINGVDIDIRRTGPALNLMFDFTGAPYALSVGDVCDIKVEHFNAGNQDFDGTIYGY
jgi:hypothetical protein